MKITRKLQNNFTVVDNEVLKIKELSLQAKGIYVIMISLPEDWNFSVKGLATLSSNKETATNNAIQELESAGLLKRSKYKDEKGYFDMDYTMYDTTTRDIRDIKENPSTENPYKENPRQENHQIYKENNNKENNNKENNNNITGHKQISEVINLFKVINPTGYKKFFMAKAQKKACEDLLEDYNLDQIAEMIEKSRAYNQMPYISKDDKIYSPYQLQENWQKVLDKEKSMQNEIKLIKIKKEANKTEFIY